MLSSCDLSPSSSSAGSSGYSTPASSESETSDSSLESSSPPYKPSKSEKLAYARSVIQREAAALQSLADRVNDDGLDLAYDQALDCIANMPEYGKLLITGVGKSALIGRKAAATFCSLGASFLPSVEAN
jgi:hypothetical protein